VALAELGSQGIGTETLGAGTERIGGLRVHEANDQRRRGAAAAPDIATS
jgi:hypothetical protein